MTLAEALASLGATEADVVKTLREAGVRGRRFDSCDCPVARWLKANRFDNAIVCSSTPDRVGTATYYPAYGWRYTEGLTMASDAFALAFDAGRYPELEET